MGELSPRAARGGDGAAVITLLGLGLAVWMSTRAPGAVPEGAPAWAGAQDLLLDGPDAGRWAEQAVALQRGAFGRLDPHRLPTWTLLTAACAAVSGLAVPLAGHLVNHGLQLLLGPLIYALGRLARLGVGPALVAGGLVLLQPELVTGAARFQVDVLVSVAWPLALAAGLAGGASRPGAAVAGVVTALAFTSHITTLPVVVPAAAAIVVAAPRGARLGRLGWFGVPFVAVAWGVHRLLPPMPLSLFLPSVLAGIVPIDPSHAPVASPPLERVLDTLRHGGAAAGGSLLRWAAGGVVGGRVPGGVVAGLVLLGVLGGGLGEREREAPAWLARVPRGVRLQVEWATRGAPAGLALLLALGPLPALFVANAPLRYANTLLPLVVLLTLRGVAVVGAGIGRVLGGARAGNVAAAALAAALAVGATAGRWPAPPGGPDSEALMMAQVGAALQAKYPPGTDVATFVHEVSGAAGELACPTPDCPTSTSEAALVRCLATIRSSCAGDPDSVPYAVVVGRPRDDRFVTRAAMDDFVLGRWPPFATFEVDSRSVSLVAVPRRADE